MEKESNLSFDLKLHQKSKIKNKKKILSVGVSCTVVSFILSVILIKPTVCVCVYQQQQQQQQAKKKKNCFVGQSLKFVCFLLFFFFLLDFPIHEATSSYYHNEDLLHRYSSY